MSDIPETPGSHPELAAALAGRYTIEREFGRGGNAIVYLAHDRKHNRKVALKVLLSELAQSVRAERFLREIQIAAQLHHSHILMLIDSGETDRFLYYVMPFVDGESLRDRLQREKQLPLTDALHIAREVADALSYAHRRGVVHRDIKPENILLQEGHAVVADFGIARALSEASGHTVTQTGIAVGTPVYMSPEQGAGSRAVDGRSDVYSLASVLYEMLAGRPPFTGETPQEILAHHALDPAPRLRKLRPEVPAAIEDAVLTALAKRPAERFATADAFGAALAASATASGTLWRRVRRASREARVRLYAGLGLAVLLVATALATRAVLHRAPIVSAPAQSVAVLPFVTMSGDPSEEYFSDGVSEELIDALVQVEGLRVPARTSAFAFKGKNESVQKIARELNVAHVVEGSIRRAGNVLRITAQLINVSDGYHMWSHTYERELKNANDVFTLQDDISRQIVRALRVKLAGSDTAAERRPTRNLEAYDLYLKGRYFFNKPTQDGVLHAIQSFEAATAKDSTYALAYGGLADSYLSLGTTQYSLSPVEALSKGKIAALKAVALDSASAETHTALAYAQMFADWDWTGAERELRRAIALNRNYAAAHARLCQLFALLGRYAEGAREGTIAVQLDPLSLNNHQKLALIYYLSGRNDEALREFREAAELGPDIPYLHTYLGSVYFEKNQMQRAIAEFKTALRLQPDRAASTAKLAALYAHVGRRDEAWEMLNDLQSRTRRELFDEAIVHVHLGETNKAIAILERRIQSRGGQLVFLVDPFLEPIRADPRYIALLKKIGLRQ